MNLCRRQIPIFVVVAATLVGSSQAFAPSNHKSTAVPVIASLHHAAKNNNKNNNNNNNNNIDASHQESSDFFFPFPNKNSNNNKINFKKEELPSNSVLTTAAAVAGTGWLLSPLAANAAGPDWGLFEGRTGSLIHPAVMGGLFLYSLYTAYLGFQWRRQRTMGDEISALKAQLTTTAITQQDNGDADDSASSVAMVNELQVKNKGLEAEIQALTQERKALAASGPRDKHFAQGATLSFLGTAIAIEGCLNTFGRAGKLFPGPHLYAGAALVVLWALAVSTVPAMQKGNDVARTIHIGANVLGVSFFFWQVTTGIPILLKVIDLTSWP